MTDSVERRFVGGPMKGETIRFRSDVRRVEVPLEVSPRSGVYRMVTYVLSPAGDFRVVKTS